MRIHTLLAAATIAATLTGCYTYPVYRPVPVARLTPEQSAAIASNQSLSQADRDRLTRDNAQVAQQDSSSPYTYAAPVAPAYYAPPAYYADPYYYGYPYYGAYYGGFYPGLSLSLGFRGYYGGGWRGGGWHGHR
jgi:hypothetical protein